MKWTIINFVETIKHKLWVMWYILKACLALVERGIKHDLTKFSKHERPYFERSLPKLRNLEYGSEEYKEAIKSLGPALDHHYSNNRHHPEFYRKYASINGMSPIDLIEMLCDWKAAGKRHTTGDMWKSMIVNRTRFDITDCLFASLFRTAKEIGLMRFDGKEE